MKKRVTILGIVLALALVFGSFSSVFAAFPDNGIETSQKIKSEVDAERIALNFLNEVKTGKYKTINTADLKADLDAGKNMLLVDTMPEGWYAMRHVPTAVNAFAPLKEKDEAAADPREQAYSAEDKKILLDQVKAYSGTKSVKYKQYYNKKTKKWVTKKPAKKYLGKTRTRTKKVAVKNKKIVVYCGFVVCTRSHVAAKYLVEQGYTNVYRYPGGISAWVDAEYPVEGTDADNPEARLKKVLSGEDTETVLIDARDSDAYAGWALGEAVKGGHFKGAINLDSAWIGNKKMEAMLTDNGMSPDKSYIVYDTNGKDAKAIAEYLDGQGYKDVAAVNAVDQINGDYELESYANYDLTVPASVVKSISDNVTNGTELTDAAKAVVGDSKNIVILECSWGAPEDTNYVTGHVPGAYHIDTNETDPPGTYVEADNERYLMDYKYEWRLNSDENLIKLFASRGITKDSCVIVTGKSAAPVSRCGILAKYVGVNNVHIMSKGYTGWNNEGYEMETTNRNADLPNGPDEIAALSDDMFTAFGSNTALNPGIYEKTDYVKSHIGTDGYQLVDNRRDNEWNGLTPNYDYEDLAGRIDGSIHSTQNSYNPDNSMRSKLLQDAKWTGDGIDLSKHMVFFCGDGWRAAVDTWNAWVLGYDASIYHGWMEWSNSGCDFINKDGDKVHYDKDQQAVVNSVTGEVVQKLYTKLEFEKESVSVEAKGTYENLNILHKHEDMVDEKAPVFSSSREDLVTVDQNGVVTVLTMPDEPTQVTIKAEVKGYENNAGTEDREASYVITLGQP